MKQRKKGMYLLEGVFNHGWYESREVRTRELEARVGVDLDHPGVQVLVYHEVVSEYLERCVLSVWVHLAGNCTHRVLDQLPYLRRHVLGEVALDSLAVQILLELLVAQLVA